MRENSLLLKLTELDFYLLFFFCGEGGGVKGFCYDKKKS